MDNENQHAVSKNNQYNQIIVTDEKTDQKIHEHLSNKNDVISDQDIANAAVNLVPTHDVPLDANSPNDIPADKKDQPKNDDKEADETSIPIITPWNVLG